MDCYANITWSQSYTMRNISLCRRIVFHFPEARPDSIWRSGHGRLYQKTGNQEKQLVERRADLHDLCRPGCRRGQGSYQLPHTPRGKRGGPGRLSLPVSVRLNSPAILLSNVISLSMIRSGLIYPFRHCVESLYLILCQYCLERLGDEDNADDIDGQAGEGEAHAKGGALEEEHRDFGR